jgi:molecular chaperone IbpA
MTNFKPITRDLPDFYKTTVGFDRMFAELERRRTSAVQTGYPPYNILRLDTDTYLIELAVAGFDEKDFDVTLHNGILTVKASNVEVEEDGVDYIHRGIAARSFERSFQLASTVRVNEAYLKRGMLSIKLVNEIPEEKKLRQIEIKSFD